MGGTPHSRRPSHPLQEKSSRMLDALIMTASHLLPPPKATLRNGERGENYESIILFSVINTVVLPFPTLRSAGGCTTLTAELVRDKKTEGKLNEGAYIYKIVLRSP